MRFRVPSLFLSLYLGYNNLANLYMIYIHRILVIFFCLFFSTVSAQKVGLVLSGGGAKGLTHIGIIRALEENNIPIDYVTGTSMGAIVGSLYAMGYSPDDMEKLIKSEDFKRWYSGGIQEKYISEVESGKYIELDYPHYVHDYEYGIRLHRSLSISVYH